MAWKSDLFNFTARTSTQLLGLQKASRVACRWLEWVQPEAAVKIPELGKTIYLNCPNELTWWRANTFLDKEPEIIEWINGFAPTDQLLDIGGNIGLYSLYAALKGHHVLAIEPESQNYALMQKNIWRNQVSDRMKSLNLALGDRTETSSLFLNEFKIGAALHNVGEAKDFNNRAFVPGHVQTVMVYRLDDLKKFWGETYFPNHIKIDVDGLEPKIIAGAHEVLSDSRLKSLYIEFNEGRNDNHAMLPELENLGFEFKEKRHSEMTATGDFSKLWNYIFVRKAGWKS